MRDVLALSCTSNSPDFILSPILSIIKSHNLKISSYCWFNSYFSITNAKIFIIFWMNTDSMCCGSTLYCNIDSRVCSGFLSSLKHIYIKRKEEEEKKEVKEEATVEKKRERRRGRGNWWKKDEEDNKEEENKRYTSQIHHITMRQHREPPALSWTVRSKYKRPIIGPFRRQQTIWWPELLYKRPLVVPQSHALK